MTGGAPSEGRSAVAMDAAGEATLELFRQNHGYNELLVERLFALLPRAPRGRFLEVGCGIGNLTRILLRVPGLEYLRAIDIDPAYVSRVQGELDDERLEATVAGAETFAPAEHSGEAGGFDAIVCSNVLEHIADDRRVLENFRTMLRPGGVAYLLVPAHQWLFCGLDRNLSHHRRYGRRHLCGLARAAGLDVLRARHFNPLGAVGWWLNGKVLGRRELPGAQLSLYTRFAIPVSRLLDALNPFPLGVSLLAALTPLRSPAKPVA